MTAHTVQTALVAVGILVYMRLLYAEIKEIFRQARCRNTKDNLKAVVDEDRDWEGAA